MRPIRLAWLEIKRFRTPLQRVALIFVVLVPLLYGGLYLWSNWDPYGRLDRIPVAVVDADQPVTVQGQRVAAGELFTDELEKDRIFDWRFVDAAEASRGVHDGDYYFTISVPRDFSAKLASGAESTPRRASMLITLDDANGYVVGKMAQTVQSELENKISAAAVSAYFQSVFDNLERLRSGIDDAATGAGELEKGAGTAQQGAQDLTAGLDRLKTGAGSLKAGSRQVADGVSAITDVVVPAADRLAAAIPDLTDGAADAATRADTLAGGAKQVADTVSGDADSVQGTVTRLGREHPELADDPAYQDLVRRTGQAATFAGQVDTTAGQVKTTTGTVATLARQLDEDSPGLQSDVRGAADKVRALDTGATKVADGAAELDTGLGTAAGGAKDLTAGITTLHTGAGRLADGLADAEGRLPVLSDDQKKSNAATLASPVDVRTDNLHPAVTYGRGLTPFFFAIALVVFGITAFLVLRPVSARALASRARDVTVALAGWLPAAACCVAGGVLLYLVVDLGLGLDPVHPWAMLGLVVLAAAAFTAIAHLFRTWLGGVASAVVLVLLLLQLTTCAGTFPAETLPAVFRVLHPILPMSYLVDGLRVTITGGNTAHLVRDAGVLAVFGVAALTLTTLVVRRRREWTVTDLKPELAI